MRLRRSWLRLNRPPLNVPVCSLPCLVAAAASWLRGGRYVHDVGAGAPAADLTDAGHQLILPEEEPSELGR